MDTSKDKQMDAQQQKRLQKLPVLHVKGSHFDVGYVTGSTFADHIRLYMCHDVQSANIVQSFYDSPDGRQLCDVLRKKGEDNFPQYAAEIRGLAAGAGISYEKMFLHNIAHDVVSTYVRPDIAQSLSLHSVKAEPVHHILDHCSTILLNQPEVKVMGHNEDGGEAIHRYAYMLSAQIYDPDFPPVLPCKQNIGENEKDTSEGASMGSTDEFTAYCYPGLLPGVAFGFNGHGLVFGINYQHVDSAPLGTPHLFIMRSLLSASSIEDCCHLLENKNRGGGNLGFSVNIADVKNLDSMWSAEVQPGVNGNIVHIHPVPEGISNSSEEKGYYFQANSFQHLPNTKLSSRLKSPLARLARAAEMSPFLTKQDVLQTLGDTKNQDTPIFRRFRHEDLCDTAATGLFDLKEKRLDLYLGNPTNTLPLLSFPIKQPH